MKNVKKEVLSQHDLKKVLHYDQLTGIFAWIERPVFMFKPGKRQLNTCNIWNSRFANKETGCIWMPKKTKTSYLSIRITLNGKAKLYLAHRLAILYTDGHLPLEQVDHIDGNGLNNRRINLREVSNQENHKNKPMYSTNTSGYVGVYWHKQRQKWHVRINVDGERICGGFFINKKDAIARRKELEIKYDYHKNHGR
jgi:hypothetical protein